jgi:hypothetical protein
MRLENGVKLGGHVLSFHAMGSWNGDNGSLGLESPANAGISPRIRDAIRDNRKRGAIN